MFVYLSGCHPLTRKVDVLEVVEVVPLEEVTRGEATLRSQAREADRER